MSIEATLYDAYGNQLIVETNAQDGASATDAECKAAFLTLMARKAALLGMSGTHYESPSGMVQTSFSTPKDALKLGIAAAASPEALDVMSQPSRSFVIAGGNARTVSIANNVISGTSTDLTPHYKLLAGKGGSLIYSDHHRAQILIVEVSDVPVVLSLMALGATGYNNIFKSAKELADMVATKMSGGTPAEGPNLSAMVSASGGYAACPLPKTPASYRNLVTPDQLLTRSDIVQNNASVQRWPASTSKVMTLICALDYIKDLRATTLTLKSIDIESGSGSTFYAGDMVSFQDALYIMMMESSNTMANAIARAVGKKYLSYGD